MQINRVSGMSPPIYTGFKGDTLHRIDHDRVLISNPDHPPRILSFDQYGKPIVRLTSEGVD